MLLFRSRRADGCFAAARALAVSTLAGLMFLGAALAQECPLKSALTVKDTQDGFAGQTGTVWTIAPDCSFTVARQIGTKLTDPIKQGRLTRGQEAQLLEQLARTAPAEMPSQLSYGPPINARRITLSYAGKDSVLVLPAGDDLNVLKSTAADSPARRLLELADSVKSLTGT